MEVNYTYGILSGGRNGIRTSWSLPSAVQERALAPLWSLETESNRGRLAELLIRLLRCSPAWPDYETSKDKLNTYHIDVDLGELTIKYADLIRWADECSLNSEKYKITKEQVSTDRICNRLFGILDHNDI